MNTWQLFVVGTCVLLSSFFIGLVLSCIFCGSFHIPQTYSVKEIEMADQAHEGGAEAEEPGEVGKSYNRNVRFTPKPWWATALFLTSVPTSRLFGKTFQNFKTI